MNPTQFIATLTSIPYVPRQVMARGIVAPILRATGHLLFVYAVLSLPEDSQTILTEEEQINELLHAKEHTDISTLTDLQTLSTAVQGQIATFSEGVHVLHAEYPAWTRDERQAALLAITNRAAGLGVVLDRELAGVPADRSDPGSSL